MNILYPNPLNIKLFDISSHSNGWGSGVIPPTITHHSALPHIPRTARIYNGTTHNSIYKIAITHPHGISCIHLLLVLLPLLLLYSTSSTHSLLCCRFLAIQSYILLTVGYTIEISFNQIACTVEKGLNQKKKKKINIDPENVLKVDCMTYYTVR